MTKKLDTKVFEQFYEALNSKGGRKSYVTSEFKTKKQVSITFTNARLLIK